MDSQQTRLKKVELALTPRQLVLLWLSNATNGTWGEGARQVASPREAILRAVYASVRKRMKGQPGSLIERALLQSHREADLLFNLAIDVNAEVLRSARVRWREFCFLSGHVKAITRGNSYDKNGVEILRFAVLMFLEDLVVLHDAISKVVAEHFDRQRVLFRDSMAELKQQVEMRDCLSKVFNLVAHHCGLEGMQVEQVQASLCLQVDQQVSAWVNYALARVHFDLEESYAGLAAMDRITCEPEGSEKAAAKFIHLLNPRRGAANSNF